MDPLSVTVGAFALVGVCRKVLQGLSILQNLSQVPEDIANLVDELRDTYYVLTAVYETVKQWTKTNTRDQTSHELNSLLVKASSIIASIAAHCGISIEEGEDNATFVEHTWEASPPPPKIDLFTKFRWLKDQKKTESFRQRLKVVRLDISNYLASLNLQNSYSILAEVKDLTILCRRLSEDHQNLTASPTSITDPSSQAIKDPEKSLLDRKQSMRIASDDQPPPYQAEAVTSMSNCSCACHRVSTLETPRATQAVFGSVKLRIGGVPYITPACDQILCRQGRHSSMKVSFKLPSWLSKRTINTGILYDALGGPQMNLFTTRTVCSNSHLFFLAMQGDIAGIKKLFSKGVASVYDASNNYGYTALHYAADYGHLELAQWLLKIGAKADVQDYDNRTPTDIAYQKLLSSDESKLDGDRVQEIFDDETWLEQKQLTILHKVVLGLATGSRTLTDELSKSVKDINVGDYEGRTPLSWAAERGDEAAVRILLRYGAKCDQGDRDGNTPVHYACKTEKGTTVLSVLLNSGASPVKINKWKQTPLNWVSYFQDDPEFVKLLLFHPGVSLHNDRDLYGSTPIGNAAFSSHVNLLTFLLDSGADPNGNIVDGEAPLLDCISRNNHECFRLLLEKAIPAKLNIAFKDYNGETCLHYLARRADVATIEIFLDALRHSRIDISGLRTSCAGVDGLTPRDILALRVDQEIQKALEKVLSLVDRETASEIGSVSSEEAAYVDAFELLPELEKNIGMKQYPIAAICEVFD